MSFGALADRAVDDLLQDIEATYEKTTAAIRSAFRSHRPRQQAPRRPHVAPLHPIQVQLCKLCASLDLLENPPCSNRDSGEWIAFDNRHSGLVRNVTNAWIDELRKHGLFEKNAAAAERVLSSLRSRATTTTERDLARTLRHAMQHTQL